MQGPGCSHSSTRTREVSPLSLDDYRSVIESIYQNQYFTNHGPLAKQFESELETYLGIENVVCIGNESLALLIAIAGLEIQGEIVIPALAGHLPNQIANWLNLEVRFCDANEKTNQPTMQEISAALSERTEAIVLIETWGQRCDQQLIETLIACGLKIVIVAFESFGAMSSQGYVAHHPNVTTVFSFGYGKTLSTIQGGAIATASNEVAERFRNTRSSYGVREKRNVKATCNGRFSELQAGVGSKGLSRITQTIDRRRKICEGFQARFEHFNAIARPVLSLNESANCECFPVRVSPVPGMNPLGSPHQIMELQKLGIQQCQAVNHAASHDCPIANRLTKQTFLLPVNKCSDAGVAAKTANVFLSVISDSFQTSSPNDTRRLNQMKSRLV